MEASPVFDKKYKVLSRKLDGTFLYYVLNGLIHQSGKLLFVGNNNLPDC